MYIIHGPHTPILNGLIRASLSDFISLRKCTMNIFLCRVNELTLIEAADLTGFVFLLYSDRRMPRVYAGTQASRLRVSSNLEHNLRLN